MIIPSLQMSKLNLKEVNITQSLSSYELADSGFIHVNCFWACILKHWATLILQIVSMNGEDESLFHKNHHLKSKKGQQHTLIF